MNERRETAAPTKKQKPRTEDPLHETNTRNPYTNKKEINQRKQYNDDRKVKHGSQDTTQTT